MRTAVAESSTVSCLGASYITHGYILEKVTIENTEVSRTKKIVNGKLYTR